LLHWSSFSQVVTVLLQSIDIDLRWSRNLTVLLLAISLNSATKQCGCGICMYAGPIMPIKGGWIMDVISGGFERASQGDKVWLSLPPFCLSCSSLTPTRPTSRQQEFIDQRGKRKRGIMVLYRNMRSCNWTSGPTLSVLLRMNFSRFSSRSCVGAGSGWPGCAARASNCPAEFPSFLKMPLGSRLLCLDD